MKPLPGKICVKLLWDKCFQSLVNVEVHYPPIDWARFYWKLHVARNEFIGQLSRNDPHLRQYERWAWAGVLPCHSMPQQYKMSVSNLVTSLGKDFKGECAVLSFVLSRAKRWMFIWTRINLSFFTSPSAYNPCCAPFPRWTSLIQQLFTVPDKETLGSSPARSLWTQTYFRLGNTSAFAG